MSIVKAVSFAGILMVFGITDAAAQSRSAKLPNFECSRFDCVESSAISGVGGRAMSAPVPTPVAAAPPGGQRLLFEGAGYPACQSIIGFTGAAPYQYILATGIPVPLGSTHASLDAVAQGNLAGSPAGSSAGIFGLLQLKRTGTPTWENAHTSYLYSVAGSASMTPENLYGNGAYTSIEDLSLLANGAGVPDEIDVRLAFFGANAGGYVTINKAVCQGKMTVEF